MIGSVEHIFIKPGRRQPMQAVDSCQLIPDQGIEGDAAFGTGKRQVLLVEQEVLTELGLQPGDIRENLTVRGIRLADLKPNTLLKVGDAILELTGNCAPCNRLDELREGLFAEIDGRRGVLARVLEGGALTVGDRISHLNHRV